VSDHLPITQTEITEASIGAAGAGASIIHLRARDAANEWPDPAPALFGLLLPRNKPAHAPEVGGSTRGGPGMTRNERRRAALRTSPEMAAMNMGR